MYVAIEGVIGVGKTTLARLLQPAFESEILLEIFEENPFLSDFYADRERYAFQTQIFFLLSRYHQQRRTVPGLLAAGKSLIYDYTFAKDSLFARINLKGDELDMYYKVHEALGEKIPKPDLNIILHVPAEIAQQLVDKKTKRHYLDGKKRDLHETDLGHLKKTEEVYRQLAQLFPNDFTVIECVENGTLLSIEAVHEKVWTIAAKALGLQ